MSYRQYFGHITAETDLQKKPIILLTLIKIKMIHGIVTTKLSPGTSLTERFMYKQSGSTEEDFLNFTNFVPHVNNKKVPRYPSLRAARRVRSQKKKKSKKKPQTHKQTNKKTRPLVTVGWARSFTYKLRQFTKCS